MLHDESVSPSLISIYSYVEIKEIDLSLQTSPCLAMFFRIKFTTLALSTSTIFLSISKRALHYRAETVLKLVSEPLH